MDSDIETIVRPNGADLCPRVLRRHPTGGPLPGQADNGYPPDKQTTTQTVLKQAVLFSEAWAAA